MTDPEWKYSQAQERSAESYARREAKEKWDYPASAYVQSAKAVPVTPFKNCSASNPDLEPKDALK